MDDDRPSYRNRNDVLSEEKTFLVGPGNRRFEIAEDRTSSVADSSRRKNLSRFSRFSRVGEETRRRSRPIGVNGGVEGRRLTRTRKGDEKLEGETKRE